MCGCGIQLHVCSSSFSRFASWDFIPSYCSATVIRRLANLQNLKHLSQALPSAQQTVPILQLPASQ